MKLLIIPKPTNQLCNRILLYANIIATAIEHNGSVINPAFGEFADFFIGTSKDLLCRFPKHEMPQFLITKKNREKVFKWGLNIANSAEYGWFGLHCKKMITIKSGWTSTVDDLSGIRMLDQEPYKEMVKQNRVLFLDGPLFSNHTALKLFRKQIIQHFRPLRVFEDAAEQIALKARNGADLLIGVHMRQGDYSEFSEGRFLFNATQYCEKMRQVRSLLTDYSVNFLITSNEPQKPEDFEGLPVTFGSGHPIEDLHALSACDYIIGPPSTYSFWAAYFGGKKLHHFESIDSPMYHESFFQP